MVLSKNRNKKQGLSNYIKKYFENKHSQEYKENSLELLVNLVAIIRPKRLNKVFHVDLKEFISILETNENIRCNLILYINKLLKGKKFNNILSDEGILQDVDFFHEINKRIFAKFIPEQPQKNTLQYVLNQVFFVRTDLIWLEKIPTEQIVRIFELLEFKSIYASENILTLSELSFAMNVLSHRICGRAMETEVIKMVPEFQNFDSPFLAFQRDLLSIEKKIIATNQKNISSDDIDYKQLLILHKQCTDYVTTAFKNSGKYGISLRVNQNLLRIKQQLDRLKSLLSLFVLNKPEDAIKNTIKLFFDLVKYNCDKNNIRKLIDESTQLLSYEITQHTAKTGESYITESRKEYFDMFKSAAGGGLIVSFLCIIKLLLSSMNPETSTFTHMFLVCMNYSIGFIVIYILGYTLATKQPAMTASALVNALQHDIKQPGNSKDKHKNFAVFFARVFRSQFIAFVGNVLIVFPLTLGEIWLIDFLFDYNIAENKWPKLVKELNVVMSPAIFHAAIAGVFLFLSGIIAGSISNRDKHHKIYYRIKEHPFLKQNIGKKYTNMLAYFYQKKWAGVISNFWFGIFMGSTAFIGLFMGLNLDVRHITFAGGNLALALYGSHFEITNGMLFWGILGIGIIGLVNFLVSFSLSLGLAFRSRNIPLSEFKLVATSILQYFKINPKSFFFPKKDK